MTSPGSPISSSFWLLLDRVLGIVMTFAVNIWIARHLGPADYGLLAWTIALVTLFAAVGTLGIDQLLAREIARAASDRERGEILGTALVMKLGGSAISAAAITLCVLALKPGDDDAFVVGLVLSVTHALQSVSVVWLLMQSRFETRPILLISKASLAVSLLARIALLLDGADVRWIAAAGVLEFALTCVAGFLLAGVRGDLRHWRFTPDIMRRLVTEGWPLFASVLLIGIYSQADRLIVALLLPEEQVGYYSLAANLSSFWLFIPTAISTAFMPYFVNLRERDHATYLRELRMLYTALFYAGVFIALVSTALATPLVTSLYGEAYGPAATAFAVRSWAGCFMAQAMMRGIWQVSENLQVYRLYANVASVAASLALNILLVPALGITGSAIATVIVAIIGTWLVPLALRPMRSSTLAMLRSCSPAELPPLVRGAAAHLSRRWRRTGR